MKKFLFGSIMITSLILIGCGGSNQQVSKAPTYQCQIDGTVAPEWVCNGGANMEGGIFAVGSAPKSPLGIGFQRQEAMAQARDEIVRQLDLKVKNMMKSYMSSTGTGDSQTAERVATSVSKQVASKVLRGSKLLKTWISPKGTMYVLVGMKGDINELVAEATKTTFKNDKALWQEFKAKKAQEELDSEVEKEDN